MIETKSESEVSQARAATHVLPISVIVPVRNEASNLPRCLESLALAGEVYVIDSKAPTTRLQSRSRYGAKVVQFHYQGGWPKKRQWGMDTLPLAYDWILLLDADEVLTPELAEEIRRALQNPEVNGYYISPAHVFSRKHLRHCDASFWKLSLFRKGQGHFECRLKDQDTSMADIEIHEHVVVDGPTAQLRNALVHHNVDSLSRYILKHNEYSNWEARVLLQPESDPNRSSDEVKADLFGTQAQRRRWLKRNLYRLPGSPVLLFFYRYVFRLGFLDGVPGLIYCAFQAVQMFHTKAKDLRTAKREAADSHVRHQRPRELRRPGNARPHDKRAGTPRTRRLRPLGAAFRRWQLHRPWQSPPGYSRSLRRRPHAHVQRRRHGLGSPTTARSTTSPTCGANSKAKTTRIVFVRTPTPKSCFISTKNMVPTASKIA